MVWIIEFAIADRQIAWIGLIKLTAVNMICAQRSVIA